ncbi:glycosyltransferase [Candidatus Saccharibacteria bacterium]|nr:glycosyltransferase [Candidatus Saccharibacteria bacterium]
MKDPHCFLAVCGSVTSNVHQLGVKSFYPESWDLISRDAEYAECLENFRKNQQIVNMQNEKQGALNNNMVSTYFLRLAAPLRAVRRLVLLSGVQTKRCIRSSLRIAKRVYLYLPFSFQTKAKHRQFISRFFPRILLDSEINLKSIPPYNIPLIVSGYVPVGPEDLFIPSSDVPIVSIVIAIYGKIDYTIRCLASIALNSPGAAFEVIIIDDCSPDDSFEVLSKVKGIRLLRNEHNLGFILSCNKGATSAKGDFLYFLNNDTVVTPDWLDELLRTFSEFPGTGLAGSKLIYPDGRLQEAGGIIWQDGRAWNFGRYQDPLLPVYNYAREVDYCSGASIMVPKAVFEEMGGFDEYFLPAYCEDADLALKIRDRGYRVIYQPLSVVVHFEGITSGTDTTQGIKSYQVENTKKLLERWQHRLCKHQVAGLDVDNAKDRAATRRALVLDHCTPTPNQDAGSVTVFNTLLLLREMSFQVTFIPEDNYLYMQDYTSALQRVGVEVLYAPYVVSVEHHLKESGERYDLVFIFRPGVIERHVQSIGKYCFNAKVLFHTVDLHYLRMSREALLQADKIKQKAANEMQERELSAIRLADASIVHSTAELEILRPLLPSARIHVFPLIMDAKGSGKCFSDRKDIVFIGGYQHAPNVDAVKYFVEEVMPLVRKQLPGVRFYAVGSNPTPDIQVLESEDVIITGFVDDLTSLLDKMRVSVAPLRYGAGIKGKIGAAMAVGLPVVATSLAAEGMSLTDGENFLVADGPAALADAISKIYHDEKLWNHISTNSLAFVDKVWGAEAAWGILAGILADMGIHIDRSAHPLSLYCPPRQNQLLPMGSIRNREEYVELLESSAIQQIDKIAEQLLVQAKTESFTVSGFCVPCEKKVSLLVDMQSGGQRHASGWTPNWRERLACPGCGMNNRQRLVATLIKQELSTGQGKKIYFMEQITPIFNWASKNFKQHHLVGSEYLGHEYVGGTVVKGIRHEDVENLSFDNGQFDLILSNDVFEHVPCPAKAFAECVRVLKSGGLMLATIPFHGDIDVSVRRAQLIDGRVDNILPCNFHGNPVSADGSLVFTDFGWDLMNDLKNAGFSDVCVDVYTSLEYGHLGGGQLVFRMIK